MLTYSSAVYAAAYLDWGDPIHLDCGANLIERKIPNSEHVDTIGIYPYMTCKEWHRFPEELKDKEGICTVCIPDPWGDYDLKILGAAFDTRKKWKHHYYLNLTLSPEKVISNHHMRYVKWAEKRIHEYEMGLAPYFVEDPAPWFSELYSNLIKKTDMNRRFRFSEDSIDTMLNTPGMYIFSAKKNRVPIGMMTFAVNGETVNYHLAAYSEEGYKLRASYILTWNAIEFFKNEGYKILNFGAAPSGGKAGGLAEWKEQWASSAKETSIFMSIRNWVPFSELSHGKDQDYFPPYRKGEFE